MFFKKVVLITALMISSIAFSGCSVPSCGPGTGGGGTPGPLSSPAPQTVSGIRVHGVPGKVVITTGKNGQMRICYIPDKFLK